MTYSSLVLQTTSKSKSTFHFQVHTVRRRGHRVTAGRPLGGRVSTNQVTDSQRSSDLVSGWLAAIAVARHPCQQLGCEPYQLSALIYHPSVHHFTHQTLDLTSPVCGVVRLNHPPPLVGRVHGRHEQQCKCRHADGAFCDWRTHWTNQWWE